MGYNGTRKRILMFLILLVCIAAVVFIGTEVFQVENIVILGSGTLDDDVIINLSGISYGDNIFKINKEKVRQRIEGNAPFPMVQAISIRLPDEVIIAVEERVPAAVIPYLSSNIIIDSSGFILDIVKQTNELSYPTIEGMHISRLIKGSVLETAESDSYKFKIMIRMLEAIAKWEIGSMIQTIYLDDPDHVELVTRDDVHVTLGQALELDRKLGWLQSDAYTEVLNRDEKGTLDVSVPGKAVFHPEPAADDEQGEDGDQTNEEDGS
ncbi:MAG TPA: FtsQ-type POTRA domain-containing protein [Clostridiales bacterium]|nr:FtsQ-type POTRA domain-containing protein [Clostridiales bacterium]